MQSNPIRYAFFGLNLQVACFLRFLDNWVWNEKPSISYLDTIQKKTEIEIQHILLI